MTYHYWTESHVARLWAFELLAYTNGKEMFNCVHSLSHDALPTIGWLHNCTYTVYTPQTHSVWRASILRTYIIVNTIGPLIRPTASLRQFACFWQVVNIYNSLLHLISRRNLPQGFSLTDSYVLLVYESYYHLGLALQNLQRHKEAVAAFSQAIKAVNIHKVGSCYMFGNCTITDSRGLIVRIPTTST